jgi:putative ABC transport system permease protein
MSKPQPPKLAERFLEWFCASEVVESLQGDLHELYHQRVEEAGKSKADLYYYLDVLDVCRPFAWKKRKSTHTNHLDMLSNHFKISFRHLLKDKSGNLLNIAGLMLGVVCCILIFLTVKYETSFDNFHENEQELYRVTNNYYYPTFTMYVGQTPNPMSEALRTDFTAFDRVFAITTHYNHPITVEEELFESDILYADADFIQGFDYYNKPDQWIIGNPNTILQKVNTTILTQSLAEKLFGSSQAAIGQFVTLSNEIRLEVEGIMKDPPNNTNFPFEQLVSRLTYEGFASSHYGNVANTNTFVQIPRSVDIAQLRPALDDFNKKYMEAVWGEDFVSMDLQPLTEIHLDERFSHETYTTNKNYLWTLTFIGLLIIVIACINFINLATAKGGKRSLEISMRKILGGSKQHILGQFLSESFLLAFIALGLGLLLAQYTFPYFSELTNLNIGNDFVYTPTLLLFILGLLVFISLSMGLYPALLFANFKPLQMLRGKKISTSLKGVSLRRTLIAFQLVISQVLIIAAIVITSQLNYFQNKDLGFEKESLMVVKLLGNIPLENRIALKQKFEQFSFVEAATLSSHIPMSAGHGSSGLTSQDSEIKERFNVQYIYADNDYLDAMNIELLAGKARVTPLAADTLRGYVVNETLIQRLAFDTPSEALGKRISVNSSEARIIGVVKDFHTQSLHQAIKPIAIAYGVREYPYLGVKYRTGELQSSVAQMEQAWKAIFPDRNFDFFFQDERMGMMYDNEVRFAKIIKVFTVISIIIACFGLIGLSAFSSVRRFKEIGVRKVLGATVPNILYLMSKEFILIMLISFVLSYPIAYYLTAAWLQEFAYSVQLEWWMFAKACLITTVLTLLTVSFQSVKAALINPIDSLRTE